MIQNLANLLAAHMVKKGTIDSDDEEVYQYGWGIIISTGLDFISMFILGCLFGQGWGTVVFLICFIIIHTNTGGYHANSYEKCYIFTMLNYCVCLAIALFVPKAFINTAILIITVISVIIIFFIAPVANVNKPWPKERHMQAKKISRLYSVIISCCLFAVALWLPMLAQLALWSSLALFATAVLLIGAKIAKLKL